MNGFPFLFTPQLPNTASTYKIRKLRFKKEFHMIVYFYSCSYICEQE
jgi:hypothetical protein